MKSTFSPITFSGMEQYLHLLKQCTMKTSDYSYANIWGWAQYYGLEWRFDGTLCWIRQTQHGSYYWAPVGQWEAVQNWAACPEFASGNTIIRVPEALAQLWQSTMPEKIIVEEARGQWDYLYLASELIALSGNRFHKKKNLLRQFEKLYTFEYRTLSSKCVNTVLQMQEEWCRWRDCEETAALAAENEAIERVLAYWPDIPGLTGGIIRVDGVPVAYTLAEPLSDDTLVIHFEKAASGLKGGYQAINQMFCANAGNGYTYINREQDLDDEGLRQAKLSYNPVGFVKKNIVKII